MVQMTELFYSKIVSGGVTDIHVADHFQSSIKPACGISSLLEVNVHIAGLMFKIIR